MKKKFLFILSLGLILSACQKDNYISQRHPEDNKSNQVEADVKYSEKSNSNEIEKNIPSENPSIESVSTESNNQESEQNQIDTSNEENIEGDYTVTDITNIRREASTDSDIVARVQPGETVYRSEIDGEWSKISYGSYEGYILTELLEEEN